MTGGMVVERMNDVEERETMTMKEENIVVVVVVDMIVV